MDVIGQSRLHYDIIEKLGEGGMGVVYKAFDNKLKREVAIKFLPWRVASNEDMRKRFHIEAQAVATLNHPNIATIYAIEELTNALGQDELFFVMEFIDGIELRHRLQLQGLDVLEATNMSIQIANGLQAAHEKGITHRDIKPANIMLTRKGRVKLMDFGLAKIGEGIQLTKANTTLGTVAYMSPEQAMGDPADLRSDVWSLGVVLYEMLTGVQPFKGKTTYELMNAIINKDHEPAVIVNDKIPPELNAIVERALMKDRSLRYQSAMGISKDLHAFVDGFDKTARIELNSYHSIEKFRSQEVPAYNPTSPGTSKVSKDSSSIIEIITQKPVFLSIGLVAALSIGTLAWYIPRIGSGPASLPVPVPPLVDSSTVASLPTPELPVTSTPTVQEEEPQPDQEDVAAPPAPEPEIPTARPPANPAVTVPAPTSNDGADAERARALQQQADNARAAMLDQERALSASQDLLQRLPSHSTALNRKATAERLYDAGDYTEAARTYAEAEALYESLQGEITGVFKTDAEQNRTRMTEARAGIAGTHPDVQEYSQAVALQREAEQSYASQDYLRASQLFEESAQEFTRAAQAITALESELATGLNVYTEQLKGRIREAFESQDFEELNTLLDLDASEQQAWRTIFSLFSEFKLQFVSENRTEERFDRYRLSLDTSLSYKDNKNRNQTNNFLLSGTLDFSTSGWTASPLHFDPK